MATGIKTRYVCEMCGSVQPKWQGKCPDCGEWNSLVEEAVRGTANTLAQSLARNGGSLSGNGGGGGGNGNATGPGSPLAGATNISYMGAAQSRPRPITSISAISHERQTTYISEFDRVLGGGVVAGSLVLICGEPGAGKCLAGTERVLDPLTGDYLPITEWANGNRGVYTLDTDTYRLSAGRVEKFWEQGEKPLVRVETRLGKRLHCTPNHPLLTENGWEAAGGLLPGARLATPRSLPVFGTETMADAEVKLIAYILSDGSARSSINVTSMLPEVADDLTGVAAHFGMTLRVYEKPGNRAKQYRFVVPHGDREESRAGIATRLKSAQHDACISRAEWARKAAVSYDSLRAWTDGNAAPSKEQCERLAGAIAIEEDFYDPQAGMTTPIARFLEDMGLRYRSASNKSVPAPVFRLAKAQLQQFLRVLFSCDGSVYATPERAGVSYSTISRRLAEDVQHLLLRFGLVARLREKRQSVNGEPYTAYEVEMRGTETTKRFLEVIGIWGRHDAKAHLDAIPKTRFASTGQDTVPTGTHFWQHLTEITGGFNRNAMRAKTGVYVQNRRHDRPLCRQTVAALAGVYASPLLDRLACSDVYWDEIVSVTPCGTAPVYDLSVPGTANFVAQGMIVHNSTLLSQVAGNLAKAYGTVLYVSGEESAQQIKLRAERLGSEHDDLLLASETDVGQIAGYIDELKPKFLIIDSIQTMQSPDVESAPGTVSQVRASTAALAAIAKGRGIPVFLVGHVTKEGSLAGPRVLEHMVDTVLYFEGDRHLTFRVLRAVKNRFGSTDELGIFEMREEGLVGVENPSELFLAERPQMQPGSTVTATIEGTRPLLVEIQALVAPSYLGSPRRTTNGVSRDRVSMILAVLEKRVGLSLANQDVYINVAGGIKIEEPAADLAIALAIASNFKEMPVDPKAVFLGEIGLSGEVRGCSQIDKRLKEAARLGFDMALIPGKNIGRDAKGSGIAFLGVDGLREAVDKSLISPSGV